ncbi:MAG: sulfotransferase [Anaerolineae bacterium]|nr:sulfotransferase [Anaerolineae bacterium]
MKRDWLRLREKPLAGVGHGYSLAASRPIQLTNVLGALFERGFLWPWYGKLTIDRPIFLIGPFRSGTTILEKIIAEHPAVGHFSYLSNVYYRAPVTGYTVVRMLWKIGVLDHDVINAIHNPRIPYTFDSPYECEWIWSQMQKGLWNERCDDMTVGAEYDDPRFERYLRSVIKRHLWVHGAPRFLSKNPVNCLRMGYLHKLFPDARFITISRHPIDTVLSHIRAAGRMEKQFYAAPETRRILQERLHMDLLSMRIKTRSYTETLALDAESPLLAIANQWKDLQGAVLESSAGNADLAAQTLQLRYEDLVSDPESILTEIWKFVDLADDDAIAITRTYRERLKPPEAAPLTEDQQALLPRIVAMVAPVASQLGYLNA